MNPEDADKAKDMIAICARAKEQGVILALSDVEGNTHIHCCSSDSPEVIRAMLTAEVAHLGAS